MIWQVRTDQHTGDEPRVEQFATYGEACHCWDNEAAGWIEETRDWGDPCDADMLANDWAAIRANAFGARELELPTGAWLYLERVPV